MESKYFHLNIDFLDNKLQNHVDYEDQYLIQMYNLYRLFHHLSNKRFYRQLDLEIQLFVHRQQQDQHEKVDSQHHVYSEDDLYFKQDIFLRK